MAEIRETVFECCSADNMATFFSSERTWEGRILKLCEKYPDDVKLVAHNQDGSVVVHLPKNWLKVSPPKKVPKRELTEEQREKLRERFQKVRKAKRDSTRTV